MATIPSRPRGRRRLLGALLLALALLLGVRAVADAHAVLVSAEPAADARLAAGPPRVRLVFSEPLEAALARLSLVVEGGRVTRLAAAADPHDVHAVVAPLPALAPGAYRVQWRVVSADGHPVEGSYVFAVGAGAARAAPPPDPHPADDATPHGGGEAATVPPVAASLRGLALGALMALAGVLLFLGWPRAPEAATPRRATRLATLLAVAAPALLAAHAAAWLVTVSPDHTLTADGAAAAIAGGAGRVELWRTVLALLALWALALARRPRLALAFAVGALVASGGSGHPAAIDPRWAEPAKAAHLLAGAAWLGGVLWLLAVRATTRGAADDDAFAVEALRVSGVALWAALLVALSGAVQALLFLASPLDLVRSTYGAIALAKVAGTLALAGFGAYHRLRILPRLAEGAVARRFTHMLRAELAVMAVVVLLGGLLAYVPPPSAPLPAPDALLHASVPDHTP